MQITLSKNTYGLEEPIIVVSNKSLSGLSEDNFELYASEGLTYNSIPFTVTFSTSAATAAVIPTIPLTNNKIHILVCKDFGSLDGELLFLEIREFVASSSEYSRNYNDVYYQLRSLYNILSIDDVVNKVDNYDFIFNPTNFSLVTDKYEYESYAVSALNTDLVIDNYVDQYYREFSTFFHDAKNQYLKNPSVSATLHYSESYLNDINLALMKNVTRYNALKGNQYLIEFMMLLYSKILGYYFISVNEDPTHNFVYRVSSSIPPAIWNKNIKPIIHPLSWGDIYNYVPSIVALNVDLDPCYYLRRMKDSPWRMDCISYLDAEMYSRAYYPFQLNTRPVLKRHFYNLKRMYHNQGGWELENIYEHSLSGHKYCIFNNPYDQAKFNVYESSSAFEDNYYIPTLAISTGETTATPLRTVEINAVDRQTRDLQNYWMQYDALTQQANITYKTSGIALTYIWEKFNKNTRVDSAKTYFTDWSTTLSGGEYVVLTLMRGDWRAKVLRYDLGLEVRYKATVDSWLAKSRHRKFLDVRNYVDNASYIGNTFQSFTTERKCHYVSWTNDFDYNFALSAATFQAEVDNSNSLSAINIEQDNYSGTNVTLATIKYQNPGIALKYEWSLYVNGMMTEQKTTYHDTVTFTMLQTNYNTHPIITLKIYHKEGSYLLTNFVTL